MNSYFAAQAEGRTRTGENAFRTVRRNMNSWEGRVTSLTGLTSAQIPLDFEGIPKEAIQRVGSSSSPSDISRYVVWEKAEAPFEDKGLLSQEWRDFVLMIRE